MLERTRKIWKRRLQARLFDIAGIGDFLDERELVELEDHMGFRGQFLEHRRFQMAEMKRLGLKPHHSLLEIGCGPMTAGIPAIEYLEPGRYVGIDVRPNVLNLAWRQIGKYGLTLKNPRLIRSNDFGAEELGDATFDYVWSFSVLYHLSDELLDQLFANVVQRLKPSGMFVANVQVDVESNTWLDFPFLKRSVGDYRAIAEMHGLKVECLGTLGQRGIRPDAIERTNPLLKFTL